MSIFERNTGRMTDPYQIWTEDDLREIPSIVPESHHYILKSDISLTANWNPISEFRGVLEGNGFSINNIVIRNTIRQSFIVDLYGHIRNLSLNDIDIDMLGGRRAGSSVGGLASQTSGDGVTIKNVTISGLTVTTNVTGNLNIDPHSVGGILGVDLYNTRIEDCIIEDFIIDGGLGGGISGGVSGRIEDVEKYYNNIILRGQLRLASGARYKRRARDTYQVVPRWGTVSGVEDRRLDYNGSFVSIKINFGGGTVINSTNINSSNVEIVEGGGIIHRIDPESEDDASQYSEISSLVDSHSWTFTENGPRMTYYGTKLNPIPISTVDDLLAISSGTETEWKHYILTNDIELPYRSSRFPIPRRNNIVLDGDGFAFTDLSLMYSATSVRGWGIFKTISNFHVKNLEMSNFNIEAYSQIGAFAGEALGDIRFDNCLVYNSRIRTYANRGGTNTRYDRVGGFIGSSDGHIEFHNSIFLNYRGLTAVMAIRNTGGFVGTTNTAVFKNSIFIGNISSGTGGMSFSNSNSSNEIINSYAMHWNYTYSSSSQGIHLDDISDFSDPSILEGFDFDDVWEYNPEYESGIVPTPSVFNKIILNIEEKITKSYSRIMETRVGSLSKKIRRRIIKFFSDKKMNHIDRTRRKGINSKNYAKKFLSEVNTVTIRKALHLVKSFTRNIRSSVTLSKIKKIGVNVKSFTSKFKSSTITEEVRKSIRQIISHSKSILIKIQRFSNLEKIGRVVIISNVGRIVSGVKKQVILTKNITSYMESVKHNIKLTLPARALKKVYAYISMKLNNTNVAKHENRTKLGLKSHRIKIKNKSHKTKIKNKSYKTEIKNKSTGGED